MNTKKTTALPTYPTAADVTARITKEFPQPDRMHNAQKMLRDAARLVTDSDPGDQLAALIREHLDNGTEITPQALADAAKATTAHRDVTYASNRLTSEHKNMSLPVLPTSDQQAGIFTALAEMLDEVVTAVRALPQDTPTDADTALAYGDDGLELYQAIAQLVGTYGAIRKAQAKYHTGSGSALDLSGHFRDATDAETAFLDTRRRVGEQYGAALRDHREKYPNADQAREYFTNTPVSPFGPIRRGYWPEGVTTNTDYARFLIWAAREHDLWVPTPTDLEAQHNVNTELVTISTWITPSTRKHVTKDILGRIRTRTTREIAGIPA